MSSSINNNFKGIWFLGCILTIIYFNMIKIRKTVNRKVKNAKSKIDEIANKKQKDTG